jgi:hypothetical protein
MIKYLTTDTWLHADLEWNEIAMLFSLEIQWRYAELESIARGERVVWN